jgi:hypothetical protein
MERVFQCQLLGTPLFVEENHSAANGSGKPTLLETVKVQRLKTTSKSVYFSINLQWFLFWRFKSSYTKLNRGRHISSSQANRYVWREI